MDMTLIFRRARTSDLDRIMEIIRQAQAQMRALGSLQWQDGYPGRETIESDIANGYGWVFEKSGRELNIAAEATQKEAHITWRYSIEDETSPSVPIRTSRFKLKQIAASTLEAVPSIRAEEGTSSGEVVAYGALVFTGEPSYEALKGKWLTDEAYVVLHRLAVANSQKRRGIAATFFESVEALAHAKGVASFRVDTNFDNHYMLHLIEHQGFVYCGTVYYRSGERLAFEKRITQ